MPSSRRVGDSVEWTAPIWANRYPIGGVMCLLFGVAFDTGIIGGSLWALRETPILKSTVAMIGLLFTYSALQLWPGYVLWLYGRHVFRLGPTLLEHEVFVGRWRCRHHRIALARLLEFAAGSRAIQQRKGDGEPPTGAVPIRARLAASVIDMEIYGHFNAPLAQVVVEATREQVRALGRPVAKLGTRRS